ncbi:MAG: rod shape-determining protein RodA [Methylibium sp. NZG]|nr:MAG: rod shape-determining protein RodA [Methylibium sp. NZG]
MRHLLRSTLLPLLCAGLLGACASAPNPNMAPAGSKGVYFVAPANGATVTSPFMVKFGLKGMEVRPAGEQVAGTGHHHLLINRESMAPGQIIPVDDVHIHYGKGQTEAELKLAPGTYRLTMQFADGFHLSYGKEMSATLTVTVK